MSARAIERALARMASSAGCVLAPERNGAGYGLFPNGDRRRRPVVKLSGVEVGELQSSGALVDAGDGAFAISEAGRARVRRDAAAPGEAFVAQHRPIIDRTVMSGAGAMLVRGHDADPTVRRLAALRDASGAAWLSAAELAAAARLRGDWEAGERGLVRGSDWAAPPNGAAARGLRNAREGALAAHCDARRRVAGALVKLAPPLRRVVERVCLRDEGLEALERAESWPGRSGKIALKLALAQLAAG
jgi:hypothetical protein